jgi:DNA-binding XRE family transcriptional regulator
VLNRRFNVVSGIPVRSEASLWVIPRVTSASETTWATERDCCNSMSIERTVVSIWNTCKPITWRVLISLFHFGYYKYLIWVYLVNMPTGSQKPTVFSLMVAAQVRAERAAARLTGAKMIEKTGLSRSTYLRIENGTRIADAVEIGQICSALGMPVSEFFHRVEARLLLTT